MFEQSLEELESGYSLGDTRVVTKLVGQFYDDVANAPNINALLGTVNRFAGIFAGIDDNYRPVEGWNDGRNLGQLLARRLHVSAAQASIDIFRAAFGVLAREIMTLVKESAEKPDAEVEAQVRERKRYVVACLMGTVDTLYPEGGSQK